MNVQLLDIDGVKPYDKNPRKNDKAVDKVAKSLELYGWQQPIVVDRENVIVVGHTRWKAAKKLGMKTVPVVEAKKDGEWLSDAECRAYRIADNKTSEFSEWDDELLHVELEAIRIDMPEFDVGFMAGTFVDRTDFDGGYDLKNSDEEKTGRKCTCPKCGLEFTI